MQKHRAKAAVLLEIRVATYDTARIVHSQHPANVDTEIGSRVEAVEQARRGDSSGSIQFLFS
jgi:hypothetical protein